jgi:integrase
MITAAKYIHKPRNSRKPHTARWWDEHGQHEISFASDREAIDARDRMLADARAPQQRITFGAAFAQWIAAHPCKPSTRRQYASVYAGRLESELGGRRLADVAADPNSVEKLAQSTRGAVVLVICCGVAGWAQREGIISDNRLVRSQLRHGTVKRVREHVPYTEDQLADIVTYLGSDGILARVMDQTGCRVSEALALTSADFTASDGMYQVSIARQQDRATGRDTELKISGKSRVVPVSAELYQAAQEREGRLTRSNYSRFGDRLRLATTRARVPFSAHNFRHACALRWESRGMRVADIAAYLGDTVGTVQQCYLNHPSKDARKLVLGGNDHD